MRKFEIDNPYKTPEEAYGDAAHVFSSPEGERLLTFLHLTEVERGSYCKGDTHETARREGRRDVVLDLKRWALQGVRGKRKRKGESAEE